MDREIFQQTGQKGDSYKIQFKTEGEKDWINTYWIWPETIGEMLATPFGETVVHYSSPGFFARTGQPYLEGSWLRKAKDLVFWSGASSNNVDMSWLRTAPPNKRSFKSSICDEDSSTDAVGDSLQHIPGAWTIKVSQLICLGKAVSLFWNFIGHSQNKFPRIQKDAEKDIILSVATVDASIVIMTHLYTDSEIRTGYCPKLYANYYTKDLLEVVTQLLGNLSCLVPFLESGGSTL